jgi:hypothetical protein
MDETIRSIEVQAPFLPREQVVELCSGRKVLDHWREEKIKRHRWRYYFAWWRQRQIAKRNAAREMRFVDGTGAHILTVDDHLAALCRTRYGNNCLQDPDFRRRLVRDHPEVRVPSPPRRLHPVNGFRDDLRRRVVVPAGDPGPGVSLRASHESVAAPLS